MSLFTLDEICEGCMKSQWHIRCMDCFRESSRFCHCEDGHENQVSYTTGKCEYKKLQGVE